MVFQDPMASLDPAFTIGYQLGEAIRQHEKLSRHAARERAANLLKMVHIPDADRRLSAYPHQLSGGMRQRAMIAIALSCHPRLLIADEPTTALDVTVQAQVVELLKELRETQNLAVLFVTHDLALISELSDEINVMYAGQLIEHGSTDDLFAQPKHPYTAALLSAQPGVRNRGAGPSLVAGQVPQPGQFPQGCRFHPRCIYAEEPCRIGSFELLVAGAGRESRCRRLSELQLPGVRSAAEISGRVGTAPVVTP
jgi:oligopeptide/dipeptide ABC transporter ATP-binding protein